MLPSGEGAAAEARKLPYYHRPAALNARIDELEELGGRGAASFDALQELAVLRERWLRRHERGVA